MRTSINLPDEVIATVRDRAAADGITPAEWMRRAILEAVTPRHPDEHPAGTPGNTPDETPISSRDGTIARADVLAADLDTLRTRADVSSSRAWMHRQNRRIRFVCFSLVLARVDAPHRRRPHSPRSRPVTARSPLLSPSSSTRRARALTARYSVVETQREVFIMH